MDRIDLSKQALGTNRVLERLGVTRSVRRNFTILAVGHLIAQLVIWLPNQWRRTDMNRDVAAYYYAARHARQHRPLYTPKSDYDPSKGWPYPIPWEQWYLYPPPFAAALSPLGSLRFTAFSRIWYLVLLVSFWIYAWCLSRLALERATIVTTLGLGLLLLCTPSAYYALSIGQVDPLLWALFSVALVCPRARGIGLGVGALIKPYLLFPLALSLWREGKRVGATAACTLLIGLSLGALPCGIRAYPQWVSCVSPVLRQGTFDFCNISISFAGLRLMHALGWSYSAGPLPAGARMYLTFMQVTGPLFVGWLCRRRCLRLQYACLGIAAAFCSPYCMNTYLPLLLVPLALWWHDTVHPMMRHNLQPAVARVPDAAP